MPLNLNLVTYSGEKSREDILFKDLKRPTGKTKFREGNMQARGEEDSGEMYYFDLTTILSATNNFSDANKLGQGGFGPVYKVKKYKLFH